MTRLVFSHNQPHTYEDRSGGGRVPYRVGANQWKEMPDAVAEFLLEAHGGTKLCDVTDSENPNAHACSLTPDWSNETVEQRATNRAMAKPVEDGMVTTSAPKQPRRRRGSARAAKAGESENSDGRG